MFLFYLLAGDEGPPPQHYHHRISLLWLFPIVIKLSERPGGSRNAFCPGERDSWDSGCMEGFGGATGWDKQVQRTHQQGGGPPLASPPSVRGLSPLGSRVAGGQRGPTFGLRERGQSAPNSRPPATEHLPILRAQTQRGGPTLTPSPRRAADQAHNDWYPRGS